MPFVVVFSFLRHSGHLPPRSFSCLLPCSCCLRPQSLMPLLHSRPFQWLFPNVCPFQVSCTILSWLYHLRSCPLRHATFAQWVISLRVAANSFQSPQFPWVRIFLKTFPSAVPLLHDGTHTYGWQPTSCMIHNLLRSVPLALCVTLQAGCWSLCHYFHPWTSFTMASPLGTSQYSDSNSVSSDW
jgi:hypothetical protein